MQYLKYTYVDSLTGISADVALIAHGPASPAIDGLEFGFALESQYPTDTPTFYGTCSDAADIDQAGVLDVITKAEYDAAWLQETKDRVAKKKALLLQEAAAKRWSVEQGGITLANGLRILTAKDDQDRIDTALNNMERYALPQINFKAAGGTWVTLTYEDLKALGQAVVAHVQACFDAERVHAEAIAAIAADDLDAALAYDVSTGWPAN